MGKPKKLSRSFAGKWQVSCIEVCDENWLGTGALDPATVIWEFTPTDETVFPDGKVISGILRQDATDYDCTYHPESATLVIDQSLYTDDGFLLQCIEDLYHIEYPTADTATLHAIRFSDFPLDGQLRIKLKKI